MANKIKSRKFISMIIWTVYALASLIITKELDTEMVSWFGLVTITFIGSNVLQKFIFKEK